MRRVRSGLCGALKYGLPSKRMARAEHVVLLALQGVCAPSISAALQRRAKEILDVCNLPACGNQHGLHCPDCLSSDGITISATVEAEALLCTDGTDANGGDTTWSDDSAVRCASCGRFHGVVSDLLRIEEWG